MRTWLSKLLVVLVLLGLGVALMPLPTLADGPVTDPHTGTKDLPPGIDRRYPSEVERVVSRGARGNVTINALCDTMWWYASSQISDPFWGSHASGIHTSLSRDEPNHSYPCDIDKIGVRGRFWYYGNLREDTGMQYAYDSADKTVQSDGNGGDHCSSIDDPVYVRGNHYFEEAGIDTWEPITDNTC